MNEQYFEQHSTPPKIVGSIDENTDRPIVNSDPFEDKVPVDAAQIYETPMGGTVAAVGPMSGPLPDQVPMFETPSQEIPMGGTVAPVGPMNEKVVQEDHVGATVPNDAMLREPLGQQSEASRPIPNMAPMGAPTTHESPTGMNVGESAGLLNREETEHFRMRWSEIQGMFVDEPRSAVQQADALVSEVSTKITQMFASEHSALESQWNQGNDVSTEDLRKALQRYRSFFNRLVI